MTVAVKLARAVGTGGVLAGGQIQAAQVTGLAAVAASGSYLDLTNTPAPVDPLPTQTNNANKYLKTNGSTASWATLNVLNSVPITLNSGSTASISVAQGYFTVLSRDGTTLTNIAVTS